MKKIPIAFILLFALSACSLNDVVALLVTPTVSPAPSAAVETTTPTVYYTPSQTPTITAVPSFTSTPTLAGLSGSIESGGVGGSPLPTLILVPTATTGPQISFFSEPGSLILSIAVSSDILYWGYCDAPKYVDFETMLANNLRVKYVLLFLRLKDKGSQRSTDWGTGAIMKDVGANTYTYRIYPDQIARYEEFRDAWVEYQVVASTSKLKALGRSPVHRDSLSLQWCRPAELEELE